MKKKLSIVTLLLASTMVATSCDSDGVTLKEEDGKSILFSFTNEDGKTTNYYADDLLDDLQDSSSAKSKIYSEISRQVFTQYAKKTLDAEVIKEIEEDAAVEVDEFKENCKASAKEEGTDYDAYLESALATNGVETTEELLELYIYKGLKEEILDDYLETRNDDTFRVANKYNYFLDKYLSTYTPYQVKHILVAANTADTNYIKGTMTADNARKLLTVMNRFIAGDTFSSIANITDDVSSAANGGVMPFNEAQNYVPEFRFATYAQEIFGDHVISHLDNTAEDYADKVLAARYEKALQLHIVSDDEDSSDYVSQDEFADSSLYKVYEDGIGSVNLTEIMALNEQIKNNYAGAYNYFGEDGNPKDADLVLPTIAEQPYEMNVSKYDDKGKLNDQYYEEYELQRNQIFNKTLNTHQVKYITLDGEYANLTKNVIDVNGEKVLADENGNPIFFALASTGIHFMSIVWNANNPYIANGEAKSPVTPNLSSEALEGLSKIICTYNNVDDDANKSYYEEALAAAEAGKFDFEKELNHAYFTLYDTDSKSDLDEDDYRYTYIGQHGAYKTSSKLKTNSSELLSDISSYASGLEYHLFDALVYNTDSSLEELEFKVNFFDKDLEEMIKEYVQDRLDTTDESFASSVQSAAETYGSKLAREKEVKDAGLNWEYDPNKNNNA